MSIYVVHVYIYYQKAQDHSELVELRKRLESVEGDNAALLVENSELRERVASLTHELSVKEAKWCEEQEQYKRKVRKYFGS